MENKDYINATNLKEFKTNPAFFLYDFFYFKNREQLSESLDYYFSLSDKYLNKNTEFNIYFDEKSGIHLWDERKEEAERLRKKIDKSPYWNFGHEILYINFNREEINETDFTCLLKKIKKRIREMEKIGAIPESEWEYFIFHCNEDDFLHFHRLFKTKERKVKKET